MNDRVFYVLQTLGSNMYNLIIAYCEGLVLAVTTAGSYTITLKATGSGGTDTKSKVFTFIAPIINTPPVASFTYSPNQNLIAPTKITFTNTSQNADSYQWDFGDGTTSTEVNPLKEFSKSGTFNVKLIAFSKTAFAKDNGIERNFALFH